MPRIFSLLLALVVILAGIVASLPLFREKAVQRRQILVMQKELREEQARTRDLNDKINSVKTDPRTVERLAREKFGLARTGETIFKFRGDLPQVQPQGPARSAPAPRPAPVR